MIRRSRFAALSLTAALAAGAVVPLAAAEDPPAPVEVAKYTFDAGAQGWAGTSATCELLGLGEVPDPFCSVTNGWNSTDKALETRFATLANAEEALVGTGVQQSPEFTVPADASIGSAALTVDRRATVDAAILEAGGRAWWRLELVDVTPNTTTPAVQLLDEELTAGDSALVTKTVRLDGGHLTAGHKYRLRSTARFTSETASVVMGEIAVVFDNVALTIEPPIVGPPGEDGEKGETGDQGAKGATGESGDRGAPGEQGSAGAPGVMGPTGAPGAIGVPGSPGEVRTVVQNRAAPVRVNSAEARRLLRIDRLTKVRFRGPFANQLRLRVFCRTAVLSRCEGTVKLRTIRPINVALKKGRRQMKKVTLGTGSYQLLKRQIGYGKVFLTPLGRRLVKARAPIAVTAQVTVLDQQGRQQRLQRSFTVRVR